MENPAKEKLIKLSDVPQIIYDMSNITRCRSLIYSWAKKGRLSYTNDPIKLKTVMKYGHLYTTKDWLVEFLEALGPCV
jgi:hypothetical protein